MKTVLKVLTILTLISCSTRNNCENRFNFLSCDSDIPIIQIEYSKHSDSIRDEIQNQFKEDLCERCSWVDFKIPFEFDNKKGYLKVIADFDYPIGKNCPVPMRVRYYYTIMINRNNQLLVNGQLMHIDSLKSSIIKYYDNVGNPEGNYPEKYNQVNFLLFWDRETETSLIEKLMTEISKAHLSFVEQKVAVNGFEFCKLTISELEDLKNKYPLRIEFDLGKIERMKPPNIEKLKELESIETIEDSEFETEI